MGISLEQLADGSTSDRNFQKLQVLVLDTGGASLGLRMGTGSVTFTAANTSAVKVVSHGLGRTPAVVLTTPNANTGFVFSVTARASTTFSVQGFTTGGGSVTTTVNFDWVAIG